MVKSFQGKMASKSKPSAEKLCVKDVMSVSMIVFRPEHTMQEAIEILLNNKISGGPVVNTRNEVVGIISEGDCINYLAKSQYYNLPSKKISITEYMNPDVEVIDCEMSILEVSKKFLTSKRRRFPVVKDNKLIGIISQKDVLKASIEIKPHTWVHE